jgi:glyoxylase-like metal-dependent hydrolase (beta-lactamase superfamily II)
MDSVGRSDLPGGDARTLKRSFERLSRLPVDLLLPGHGPAIEDKDRVKENFKFVRKVFFSAM